MAFSVRNRPSPRRFASAAVAAEWFRYLERTRAASPAEYERVEERAWRRLASNLAALGAPLDSRRPRP